MGVDYGHSKKRYFEYFFVCYIYFDHSQFKYINGTGIDYQY